MGLGRTGSESSLKNVAEIAHLSEGLLCSQLVIRLVQQVYVCTPSDAQQQGKHQTGLRTCIF